MPHPSPRERLLEAGSDLFCRLGFHAVGVDAVVEKAGTAKATLYKMFGSKEALVEAVLDREGRAWREWFIGALDAGEASPRQRLDRVVPLLREWFGHERFYGCPFINAVGEHDKRDDRLRALAIAHKTIVLERLTALSREAGSADPEDVAHQIGLIIDGAVVAAMVSRRAEVASWAAKAIACLLDANVPAAGRRKGQRLRSVAA